MMLPGGHGSAGGPADGERGCSCVAKPPHEAISGSAPSPGPAPAASSFPPAASASRRATNPSPVCWTSSPSPGETDRIPSSSSGSPGRGLLILDDWGLASLSGQGRHDLLEVLDDRYARRGTLLASQVPVDHRHDVVGDPPSATPSSTASSTTPTASLSRELVPLPFPCGLGRWPSPSSSDCVTGKRAVRRVFTGRGP